MEFKIKHLTINDVSVAQQLFIVLQQVFGVEHPYVAEENHVKNLLENPSFVCFTVLTKNEIVGGLTAYELPMYNSKSLELFIYDIAIKPEFQRMGLGRKLIAAVKNHGKENNIVQLFVDANEVDKHALDFYRSIDGKEDKVVQFTFDR